MAGALTPVATRINAIGTTLLMDITGPSDSGRGRETVQARLEAVFLNDCGDTLVVERRVRVDPVALWIHVQREHLRDVRPFQQELLPGNQIRYQFQLWFVQLIQMVVQMDF